MLKRGDTGDAVLAWQQFLILHEELSASGATGVFDDATDEATRRYQASRGLHPDGEVGDATLSAARGDSFDPDAGPARYQLLYRLASAAHDDTRHPSALVYASPGFVPAACGLVVYLHGIENNAENVARATSPAGRPCADLIGHLDRSGRSALLIVPELQFNHGSSDPGRLGRDGGLLLLIEEILGRVGPVLGGLTPASLLHTVVISHSGGFHAAAAMATRGGLPVDELCLLDSLYGEEPSFQKFAETVVADPGRRRFVNLYGSSTERRSRALAEYAQSVAAASGLPGEALRFSDAPVAPESADLGAPLVHQRVGSAHSDIPGHFVGPLLKTSRLPGAGGT